MTSEREMVARRIRATVGDANACNALHHLWRAVTAEAFLYCPYCGGELHDCD